MAAKFLKSQKGQSVFELIIFMPLFLYMTKVLFDYGDAINHSINQNKVVRGYYYYTISNDSNAPNWSFSEDYYLRGNIIGPNAAIGLDSYAWSLDSTAGDLRPKGSCVPVPGFLGNDLASDECRAPNIVDGKTRFIRSYSAFGVCTGSWINVGAPNSRVMYSLSWTRAASVRCNRVVGP